MGTGTFAAKACDMNIRRETDDPHRLVIRIPSGKNKDMFFVGQFLQTKIALTEPAHLKVTSRL